MDYRVSLDIFDGPLDLLLHLIKRHELDVCDVSLAKITDSYVRHVELLRDLARRGEGAGVDIDTVGEFLVVAATLLEIKSSQLLPRPESDAAAEAAGPTSEDGNEPDARFELVRQLLEYKRIKDSANRLEAMRDEHGERFARIPAKLRLPTTDGDDESLPPLDLEELHVWDLLAIFESVMAELGTRGPSSHEVTYDDTPIDLHAADIADRVGREKKISFRQLLAGRETRSEMIGVFLALLELIRQKRVIINASAGEDDVEIADAPQAHKEMFEEEAFADGSPGRPHSLSP